MAVRMGFYLLGPLTVQVDGAVVHISKGKQRVILAALLLDAGHTVTADRLAELSWGPVPPSSAAATLQNYVKRLRQALGTGRERIITQPGGYLIRLQPGELDVSVMDNAVTQARRAARADDWTGVAARAADALACWRGEPLCDVDLGVLGLHEIARLTDLRFQARELRVEAGLRLGRPDEAADEAQQLTLDAPLREHPRALLMAALYGCGRRAEALAAYRDARTVLIDELGSEPGPKLQTLHQQILADDPALLPAVIMTPSATSGNARPLATLPRELPAAVSGFTGRDSELAALSGLLADTPDGLAPAMLITAIGGTAGVGKTALALQWAHQAAGRFPDGQLYVNLRGYDPGPPVAAGDALGRFLRALGMPGPDIPAETEERAACYRSLLAGRQMLIVLDNAADADQVRPLLPGTPGSVAVVTSRDTLAGLVARDGARRLDLDVLPMPDAVSLLRTLIGDRVDAEPAAAAALAAQCGRLPLAMRVAAELAVARRAASLASLAADLADQQGRLDLLQAGGDARTAVRAVFSWSLRHLDPGAVRAFRLLGSHPGPDLEPGAAAALTGTSLDQAGQVLGRLTRAHLIQATGAGRYAMHDLLRDYARELAAAEGDEQRAGLTRLLDYYLQAAAEAMDALYPAESNQRPEHAAPGDGVRRLAEPDTARTWLAAELSCLVTAVAYAAAQGWPDHAIGLAATIFRYLDPAGHRSEAVILHESARSAARQVGDVAAEARALSNLAAAELRQGRDQDAARHLRQAQSLSHQAGDRNGEARAVGNLGVLAFWQGRYEQAAEHYEHAMSLQRETGNRTGEVTSLCNLADVQTRLGRYEEAAGHLQQALVLSRDLNHDDGEVYALVNLGDVSLHQGSYLQAERHFRRGLALAHRIGDRVVKAAALRGLGELDLRKGRYLPAEQQLHTALALARDVGARSAEIDALNLLGEVRLATGDHQKAAIHYSAALELARKAGDAYLQARAHDGNARAHYVGHNLDQARSHWRQALVVFADVNAAEADRIRSQLVTLGRGQSDFQEI
jgi:DNA-binding SARP family transcriptional activator/tetratricopeptide (TPR) repeat protein